MTNSCLRLNAFYAQMHQGRWFSRGAKRQRKRCQSIWVKTPLRTGRSHYYIFAPRHFLAGDIVSVILKVAQEAGINKRVSEIDLTNILKVEQTEERIIERRKFGWSPEDNVVPLDLLIDAAGLTNNLVKEAAIPYARLFKKAQELRAALRSAESPALLDGLV